MRRKSEAGQALAVTVVALVALIGFAGLGVDMGMLRYEKRLQQNAADAAAIAGANDLPPNAGAVEAGWDASATNGFRDSGSGELSSCTASGAAVGTTCVQVSDPASGPTTGPHAGNPQYVEAYVAKVQPTYFMRILGITSEVVTARAVATNLGGGGCLYTLGRPGTPTDVNVTGGSVDAANCGILDDGDLNASGGTVAARSVGVAGACSAGCPGNAILGMPAVADPLSNLVALLTSLLPSGGCLLDPNLKSGDTALPPGNYCSGITISGSANVTFAGQYALGGNFTSSTTGTVTGTGVTFYITSSAFILNVSSVFNFSAPTSGSSAGILFWQSAPNPTAALNLTSPPSLEGILYLPATQLTINGSNSAAAYTIVVANSLTNGSGTLNLSADTSSLGAGSPIKTTTLVE